MSAMKTEFVGRPRFLSKRRRISFYGIAAVGCAKGWRPGSPSGWKPSGSKKRILTVYLNIAEFGDGVFGVEAASQRYFNKPASRLSMSEAALLAAVLPNPLRFKANAPSGYVRSRQAWILRQMRQLAANRL
ncbi:monofunctional biosynthetic peptidoglycan transglycosylase [Citrobacter koseri]|nr:monofunctional biosynthetic peptidoglycan transglycosylase [Citrobacter koseri]